MAAPTRVIVTSQPDVACDVCGRRLLRGEQPDTFLAAGRRRTVCELCAPRASAEGWVRETANHEVGLAPARPRRGRNLLSRLRQPRERTSPGGELEPRETVDPVPAASLIKAEPVVALPEAEPIVPLDPEVHETAQPVPARAAHRGASDGPVPAVHGGASDGAALAGRGGVPDMPASSGEGPEEEQGSWRDAWMFVEE